MEGDVNVALAYGHEHSWVEHRRILIERTCSSCGDTSVSTVAVPYEKPRSMRASAPTKRRGPVSDNAEKFAEWKAAYLADPHTTIQSLADRFGATFGQMAYGLRGVTSAKRRVVQQAGPKDPARVEAIRAMLIDERLTLEQAGARLGITRERVRQIAKQHLGIKSSTFRHEDTLIRAAGRTKTCWFCDEQFPAATSFHDHWHEKGHTKISPEDHAKYLEVVVDYDAGLRLIDLTTKYRCTPTMIYRALRYVGREHNRRHSARLSTMAESHARYEAIAEDLRSTDMALEAIGRKHGVSGSLVDLVNKKYGTIRPPYFHKIMPDDVERMRRLRIEGMGNRAIAKELGFAEHTVWRHLGPRR